MSQKEPSGWVCIIFKCKCIYIYISISNFITLLNTIFRLSRRKLRFSWLHLERFFSFLQFGGLLASTVENKEDGTMDLDKMRERIRMSDDPHFPYTRLICIENTHNYCGGKVVPVSYMKKVCYLFPLYYFFKHMV